MIDVLLRIVLGAALLGGAGAFLLRRHEHALFDRLATWFRLHGRNVLSLGAWLGVSLVILTYLVTRYQTLRVATPDFGQQWLIGRLLLSGRGGDLYLIEPQMDVIRANFDEEDADKIYLSLMLKGHWNAKNMTDLTEHRSSVGGPLYPPTACFLFATWAWLTPAASYSVVMGMSLALTFLCGWMIRSLTEGAIRIGEAVLVILLFPNYPGGLEFGQNHVVTLAILSGGWLLWTRERPIWAGAIWGLLAFKPVFAVSVIWVPLLLRGWRMSASMTVSGLLFCLLTFPFLGPEPIEVWKRWLEVGMQSAEIYEVDPNWVWYSRDVRNLPRRHMWDEGQFLPFLGYALGCHGGEIRTVGEGPHAVAIMMIPTADGKLAPDRGVYGPRLDAGKGSLLHRLILVSTVGLILWKQWYTPTRLPTTGVASAFLLLGSLLTVYHFMHYDLLPMALPWLLLLACSEKWSPPPRIALAVLGFGLAWCTNLLIERGTVRVPIETYLLIGLWMWTGYLTWSEGAPWTTR